VEASTLPLSYEELLTLLTRGFYEEVSGVNLLNDVLGQFIDAEVKAIVTKIRDDEDKHVMMFAQILIGLMGK